METQPEIIQITESSEVNLTESFNDMNLPENLLRGVFAFGYEKPSQIQQKAIVPMVQGRDILAQAQSGTGKTGAFTIGALSTVNPELKKPQVLILVHVHELAQQIGDFAEAIGRKMKLKVLVAIGGNPTHQDMKALDEGAQFIVGTPGRVHDLIHRKALDRSNIKWLIMDEADQMLEDLFYKQVMDILKLGFPASTKVALFSATYTPTVIELAEQILNNPLRILIPPSAVRLDGIQQFYVGLPREDHKFECLCDLYKHLDVAQTVIFCNQKQKAEWLSQKMCEAGYPTSCIHGALEKPERARRMAEFKSGNSRVLVATDLIARGIDVQQLSMVVNYELPMKKENYVHRIGRAGRFGRKGTTINLLIEDESAKMSEICDYYSMTVDELPTDVSKVFVGRA